MGKTPKPLVILALPPVHEWLELGVLQAQGHVIVTVDDVKLATVSLSTLDLILGPRCWRMDVDHRPYLTLAIQEARRVRYGVKGEPT